MCIVLNQCMHALNGTKHVLNLDDVYDNDVTVNDLNENDSDVVETFVVVDDDEDDDDDDYYYYYYYLC